MTFLLVPRSSSPAAQRLTAVPAHRAPAKAEVRTEPVGALAAQSGPPAPLRTALPIVNTQRVTAILQVTTLREALKIAVDRSRRMTVLGQTPLLGTLALPWVLPLHLLIVALTADHIRHTPNASLSYCDGTAPRRHQGAIAVAVLTEMAWLMLLYGTLTTLTTTGLSGPAVIIAVVVLTAPVVELLSLIQFAVLNPEWLTLRRKRDRRPDRRVTYVLTSLVARQDGCGHAAALMELTYPQWQAADAVVIGYPASKSLISYYVRLGARREFNNSVDRRPSGRSVMFDCRRPLRRRPR